MNAGASGGAAAAEHQRFSDLQEELGFVEPTFQRSLMGKKIFFSSVADAEPCWISSGGLGSGSGPGPFVGKNTKT